VKTSWDKLLFFLLVLLAQEGVCADLLKIHALKIHDTPCRGKKDNKFLYDGDQGQVEFELGTINFDPLDDQKIEVEFKFKNKEVILTGQIELIKPSEIANLNYDTNKSHIENARELERKHACLPKIYSWKAAEELDNSYGIPEILFVKENELYKVKFEDTLYCQHYHNLHNTNLRLKYYFDDDQAAKFYYDFCTYNHEVSKKTSYNNAIFLDGQDNILEVKLVSYNTGKDPLNKNVPEESYDNLVHDSNSKKMAISCSDSDRNKYYTFSNDQIKKSMGKYIWTDGQKFYAVLKHKLDIFEQNPEFTNDLFTGFSGNNNTKNIRALEITERTVSFPGTSGQFRKGFYTLNRQNTFPNSVTQNWVETNSLGNSSVDVTLNNIKLQNGLPYIANIGVSSDDDNLVFDLSNYKTDDHELEDLKNKFKQAHWLAPKIPLFKYSFSDKTEDEREAIFRLIEELSSFFDVAALELDGCVLLTDQGARVWSARPAQCTFNPKQGKFEIIDGYKKLKNFVYRKNAKEIKVGVYVDNHSNDLKYLIDCSRVNRIPLKNLDKDMIQNLGLTDDYLSRFFNKSYALEELDIRPRDIRSILSDGISRTAFRNVLSSNADTLTSLDFRGVGNIDEEWFISAIKTLNNLKRIDVVGTNFSNPTIVALADELSSMKHLEEVRLDMPYWVSKGAEATSKVFFSYGENTDHLKCGEKAVMAVGRGVLWLFAPISLPMAYVIGGLGYGEGIDFDRAFNSLDKIYTLKILELRYEHIHKTKDNLETRLQKNHGNVTGKISGDSVIFTGFN